MIQAIPVILCGGSGTRLWPLSRSGFPKQFLCLTGNESLFQQAASRLAALGNEQITVAAPYVVSNEEHRFLVLEQLREAGIGLGTALLEPVGRNTAPALTLAALAALEEGNDPVLVVTPADQTVRDCAAFTQAMQRAIHQAAEGKIVILGITPDRPETGYGYIKVLRAEDTGLSVPSMSTLQSSILSPQSSSLPVERFVEKPDAATAQTYLDEGGYYWNAGMFVLKASVWLKALETFRPDIAQATQAAWASRSKDAQLSTLSPQHCFIRPGKAEFAAIPSESIDYAVMEPLTHPSPLAGISASISAPKHFPLPLKGEEQGKSAHMPLAGDGVPIVMVPLDAGWNDLGAWDAVWNELAKDDAGNAHIGDVLTTGSRNTLVHASSRLVSLVGVENLVVIETADAVLVADKSRCQDVKHIVNSLNQQQREEHNLHRKVHRPWGWYDSIDDGHRFKVKRIQVKPGASLSLQKHHHRAEHWIVVKGTAEITCGDKTLMLSENQSTYIPLGEVHRLANPGTIPLEIIEVQSGSYLGEDDIVRFEDSYGRTCN